jgi:hypothetical protein
MDEPTGTTEQPAHLSVQTDDVPVASYVYAIGRVEARFPNLGAEKSSLRRPDGPRPPGRPISRPSTARCPNARTDT